jgi:hypothetical protein
MPTTKNHFREAPEPDEVIERSRRNKAPNKYVTLEQQLREEHGLTEKQARTFIAKVRYPGISDREACRAGGYQISTQMSPGTIWRRISSKLGPILEMIGLKEEELGRAVRDAIHATTTIVAYEKHYDKQGKLTKVVPRIIEKPDHVIRLKAVQLAMLSDRLHVSHDHAGTIHHDHELTQHDQDALNLLENRQEAVNASYEVINAAG